jgi:hypothetical protein
MSSAPTRPQIPQTPVSHGMIAIMTLLLLALIALSTVCLLAIEGAMLAWFTCVAQALAVLFLSAYVARHNYRAQQRHCADYYLQPKIAERTDKVRKYEASLPQDR